VYLIVKNLNFQKNIIEKQLNSSHDS